MKGGSSMGFLRRIAFYLGLVLGLMTIAAAGTVALTYLLTGKFVSVEMEGEKPEVTLMTPDEVAALIREKAGRAEVEIEIPLAETEGGEGDA
jgi:hypothetical protein